MPLKQHTCSKKRELGGAAGYRKGRCKINGGCWLRHDIVCSYCTYTPCSTFTMQETKKLCMSHGMYNFVTKDGYFHG